MDGVNHKMVRITERKCSPNIQKKIKKGALYVVHDTDTLKDGTKVLIVSDGKAKAKTSRINANRFSWEEVSMRKCAEEKFREECKKTSEQLRNNFTMQEHIRIAILPCILANIAFRYGDKARKGGADNKVSILRPLSKAYDNLKESYLKELSLDLDSAHIKSIDEQTAAFMKSCSNDFKVLWYSVLNELDRKVKGCPYREMRVDAICGMLLIDMAKTMVADIDKLIRERIPGTENTIFNPKLVALREVLDAYAGEIDGFDFNETNCQMSIRIIQNRIMQIEFNVE